MFGLLKFGLAIFDFRQFLISPAKIGKFLENAYLSSGKHSSSDQRKPTVGGFCELVENLGRGIVFTNDVCKELERILRATDCSCDALPHAARWHDLGKTHPSFAAKIKTERAESPEGKLHLPHAKAPDEAWHSSRKTGYENHRPYFRHELASALAILQPECGDIPTGLRDLVAWLVATHHGKIRLGIRSLPDEKIPTGKDPRSRFARGVCDGDILVPTELGDGIKSPEIKLSLEPMALGLCEDGPFTGQPSWTDRMLALRDDPETGPLRLAWWEALLRVADERASMKNQTYTIR